MLPNPSTDKRVLLDGLLELFKQHRRWVLFFGTGTSCDLDPHFGMAALQSQLCKELGAEPGWARVEEALRAGRTLEQALDGADTGLCSETKARFRQVTGDYVAKVDRCYRDELLTGSREWVGTRLLKTLLGRLPPANPRLSVITSNYDMLIEYACSAHGIRWTTGFVGGVTRTRNWEAAQDSLLRSRVNRSGARGMTELSRVPRVELLKVHGSINRFTRDGEQIECDLWSEAAPPGFERDVGLPGKQKFEHAAVSNIDTVSRASQAIDSAQAFAVIGYGFNDPHVHDRIMEQVRRHDRPMVVMTQHLAPEGIAKLRQADANVWILLAPDSPGGGSHPPRTLLYTPIHADAMMLDGEPLWNCSVFAERILGG